MEDSLHNCEPVSFLEWVIEILHAEGLTTNEKLVAISGVALQDAHNDHLMKYCDIGRTALMSAKRKLKGEWIKVGGSGGRGKSARIIGTTPSGRICDLERVSDTDRAMTMQIVGAESNTEEKAPETGEKKGVVKGAETVSKRVSETMSKRVSLCDTVKGSLPPNDIYNSNPPTFQKETPKPPAGAPDDPFGLKTDTYDAGVRFEHGQIKLLNGTKSFWLERFGNDLERLNLALIEIAGQIRPNSGRPLAQQVTSILARKIGNKIDQDQRYDAAVKRNQQQKQQTKPANNFAWLNSSEIIE